MPHQHHLTTKSQRLPCRCGYPVRIFAWWDNENYMICHVSWSRCLLPHQRMHTLIQKKSSIISDNQLTSLVGSHLVTCYLSKGPFLMHFIFYMKRYLKTWKFWPIVNVGYFFGLRLWIGVWPLFRCGSTGLSTKLLNASQRPPSPVTTTRETFFTGLIWVNGISTSFVSYVDFFLCITIDYLLQSWESPYVCMEIPQHWSFLWLVGRLFGHDVGASSPSLSLSPLCLLLTGIFCALCSLCMWLWMLVN